MMRISISIVLLIIGVGCCYPSTPELSSRRAAPGNATVASPKLNEPRFVDVAEAARVNFEYFRGETGKCWLCEIIGGGIAWIDYDGDGLLDLFCTNGRQLPLDRPDTTHRASLFRNLGQASFTDVAGDARLTADIYGMGVAIGDIDNDGFDEIIETGYGKTLLFTNNGDGTFSTQRVVLPEKKPAWTTGAALVDLDGDGTLDLYLSQYLDFEEPLAPFVFSEDGGPTYPPVQGFAGREHFLMRGIGQAFEFEHWPAPVDRPLRGRGLGVLAADLDGNGTPEIIVANDDQSNYLLTVNSAPNTETLAGISELGVEAGLGFNAQGMTEANMGIACDDFDGDGLPDIIITHYYGEQTTCWRNGTLVTGTGVFSFCDCTARVGLLPTTRDVTGWGVSFLDYDNDGWLDLVATNGHVRAERNGPPYAMTAHIFANQLGRRFIDVSAYGGPYFSEKVVGRGLACGDFDNDGQTDVAISHHHSPLALLHNETVTDNHFLALELVGTKSNRNAVCARVTVVVTGPKSDAYPAQVVRQIMGGGSYLSASSRRINIGLGMHTNVEQVFVSWPDGFTTTVRSVAVDQTVRIVEPSEKQ